MSIPWSKEQLMNANTKLLNRNENQQKKIERLEKENMKLKKCVQDISEIDYLNTPREFLLIKLQDAVVMAESTLDEI